MLVGQFRDFPRCACRPLEGGEERFPNLCEFQELVSREGLEPSTN